MHSKENDQRTYFLDLCSPFAELVGGFCMAVLGQSALALSVVGLQSDDLWICVCIDAHSLEIGCAVQVPSDEIHYNQPFFYEGKDHIYNQQIIIIS